jgi:alkylation response protein AidB-like acyl-CoA dehydrogenase
MHVIAAPAGAPSGVALDVALEQIAACADALDAHPRFPAENLESLRSAAVPQSAADRASASLTREIALVRAVAAADASTARILDGHFNGVERLALCAPPGMRESELRGVARGVLLLGVWGADPVGAEGAPARLVRTAEGALLLEGVKTFCSGAGGVQRALVVAQGPDDDARRLAYIDTREGLEIDREWYRGSGLRCSESHLVRFHDTPVLAILGGPDELLHEPYFSRDGVRTAATWAGLADRILREAACVPGAGADDLRLHALGSMRVARGTIDRWLEHASARLRHGAGEPGALAGECRVAIAEAARTISAEAARVGGARALAAGDALDRARRDLDIFLLQHRLEPKLIALGRGTLAGDCS